jgi:S-adenosylmethionine hydrolase
MSAPAFVVSLLTDYGLDDGFAGALHGVLHRRAPGVQVVDISHGVRRQDVRAGSQALRRAAPYLAPGAVVAVVDPGVGTERRGVAVAAGDVVFVGPDNGLIPPAADALGGASETVVLEDRGYWLAAPGPTFAGRDVFAPAAAVLARGGGLADLGAPVSPGDLVRLAPPACRRNGAGGLEVEVTWVDHFGNVQLAATPADLGAGSSEVELRWQTATLKLRVVRTFAELAPGELGLLTDSYGQLAMCSNGASAAASSGLGEQDVVELRP